MHWWASSQASFEQCQKRRATVSPATIADGPGITPESVGDQAEVQQAQEQAKVEDRQAATAAQQADPTTKGKGPASREQPASPEAERTQQRASVVKDVVALGTLRDNAAQLFMP